mmetsp:Transcript_17682/g.12611  ORF Transcript_17682/g.12611 Transcript_17682/m.12611 type:complete len:83 (+) Transcript_17682:16-264(+)
MLVISLLYYLVCALFASFCLLIAQKLLVQYSKRWYYSRQGVKFVKGTLPLLGDILTMKRLEDGRSEDDPYTGTLMLDNNFGG